MIGIIGAMEVEVDALRKYMQDCTEQKIMGNKFYIGKVANHDVVLTLSGVGKVNASMSTTLLLNNFDIDLVINIGTAGGLLEEQKVLDIVIADKVIQHDFDTSYIDGEEGIGIISDCDKCYSGKANDILAALGCNTYFGNIASGDVFVGEKARIDQIKNNFDNIVACEMESGAIGYVCEKAGVKCIILRSLSDVTYNPDSNIEFDEYVAKASATSAKFVNEFIKGIDHE